MPNIVKPLKIAIDLKSITNKKITENNKNLFEHGAIKGALGSITVLSEVYDLYLITKYNSITQDEILRWLKAAEIDTAFRKIVVLDENKSLRDFILQDRINVTIATDIEIIKAAEKTSAIYWLSEVHTKDIPSGIQKATSWYDILKDVIKYSTMENYDFRYTKKKRK